MKKFTFLAALLLLTLNSAPVRAQYNPPPPPEDQGGQPGPSADNQGAPPPGDVAQMQDAPSDQGAPPPDQGGPADQGAPPPDQNAPQDQSTPQDGGAPQDQGDSGDGSANFQTFYDNLASQGNWVQTDNYGYVWQPNVQDPDWRPYSDGHWVYTDEGWTWVAAESEPWGWATYHYGRWANLDGTGWVWVPGYTWAPAWVSWRYGGGYCGWAPLPPATFVGIDVGGDGRYGYHIGGDCDTAYGIGPAYYNFIGIGFIGGGNYRGHYLDRNNNYVFINRTQNVTNIVVNNQAGAGRFGRVRLGGPSFAAVNAQSQVPVQRMTLARSGRVGNARVNGNRLAVFAPHVAGGAAGAFRPRNVAGNLSNVRVNNGANINQPLAVNGRVRPSGPSAAQVQAAQAAGAHPPAGARVATATTRPTQALSRPLSSYQPHADARRAAAGLGVTPHTGNASASGIRPESNFTGGERPTTTQNTTHVDAVPRSYSNSGSSTGEVHRFNTETQRETAPAQHEANAAAHYPGAVEHQGYNAPVQHQASVEHQSYNAVEHQGSVEHQSYSAPAQHQAAVEPQESHHQEQPQHANAPAVQHEAVHAQAQAQHPAPAAHAATPQAQHAGGKKDDKK